MDADGEKGREPCVGIPIVGGSALSGGASSCLGVCVDLCPAAVSLPVLRLRARVGVEEVLPFRGEKAPTALRWSG